MNCCTWISSYCVCLDRNAFSSLASRQIRKLLLAPFNVDTDLVMQGKTKSSTVSPLLTVIVSGIFIPTAFANSIMLSLSIQCSNSPCLPVPDSSRKDDSSSRWLSNNEAVWSLVVITMCFSSSPWSKFLCSRLMRSS